MTIHIYMIALHRALQIFWAIGCGAAVWLSLSDSTPLALAVYNHPLNLMGVGWVFVALTGLFFKEAVCFNRGETKLLDRDRSYFASGPLAQLLTASGGTRVARSLGWIIFCVCPSQNCSTNPAGYWG